MGGKLLLCRSILVTSYQPCQLQTACQLSSLCTSRPLSPFSPGDARTSGLQRVPLATLTLSGLTASVEEGKHDNIANTMHYIFELKAAVLHLDKHPLMPITRSHNCWHTHFHLFTSIMPFSYNWNRATNLSILNSHFVQVAPRTSL